MIGTPSSGKTFIADTAFELMPSSAIHNMEAGSARTVIYDDADLAHRVLVFPEADSIPAGEDNPAASALRSLLTDGRLAYKVTVRDPESGEFVVKDIEKDGPTVLVSTSVRRLAPQFDSRVFVLEVPDERGQIRAALDAQAALEVGGPPDVPLRDALVAFQELLGARAPWDVVVPFAPALATAIGRTPAAPRVTRDFGRIVSLIKAAAIVRHRHRATDERGRLVATIKDYATVRELVADVYAGSTTGGSKRMRETVEALASALRGDANANATASVLEVARQLPDVTYSAVWRRLQAAIKAGFVINDEARKGQPAILRIGETMPPTDVLPEPDDLSVCAFASTSGEQSRAQDIEAPVEPPEPEPDLWFDFPLEPPEPDPEYIDVTETIDCPVDLFAAHATRHVRRVDGWVCLACHPEAVA